MKIPLGGHWTSFRIVQQPLTNKKYLSDHTIHVMFHTWVTFLTELIMYMMKREIGHDEEEIEN